VSDVSKHRNGHHHHRSSLLKKVREGILNSFFSAISRVEDVLRGEKTKDATKLGGELSFEEKVKDK